MRHERSRHPSSYEREIVAHKPHLLAVEVTLEVEPKRKASSVKAAPKPALMRILPLAVDNPERDILVWRTGAEVQQHRILVARLLDDLVRWSLGFVNEIRVEDIKLVSLHDFRRWVIRAEKTRQHIYISGG